MFVNKINISHLQALAGVLVAALALAGCSSPGLPSLSSGATSLAPAASPAIGNLASASKLRAEPAALVKPASQVKLAMAPILGPPPAIAKKIASRIKTELGKRNVRLVSGKAKYAMRGFVAASGQGAGASLAYVWDVDKGRAKKQLRISGEEKFSAPKGRDAWSGVSEKTINSIAVSTASRLAGWLAGKSGAARQSLASRSRPVSGPGRPPRASNPNRIIMAMVTPVSGAPGDGKISLTKAIKQQLHAKGIRLTSKRTDSVYQVRGVVQMGKAKGESQPIRIDWRVYDPRGKRLGVVTQKNNIPPGSLNGAWGPIAGAAAGAAADGIVKLLPKKARRG
jgi:hypothetical protein